MRKNLHKYNPVKSQRISLPNDQVSRPNGDPSEVLMFSNVLAMLKGNVPTLGRNPGLPQRFWASSEARCNVAKTQTNICTSAQGQLEGRPANSERKYHMILKGFLDGKIYAKKHMIFPFRFGRAYICSVFFKHVCKFFTSLLIICWKRYENSVDCAQANFWKLQLPICNLPKWPTTYFQTASISRL